MDDVRFVYIEIAIKVYKCEDLLDFLKTNYKSSINIPLNLQKRFLIQFVRTLIKDCVENYFSKNLENKRAFTITIPEFYFPFCFYFKWKIGPNQAVENGQNCQRQFVSFMNE